jgi:hypothetical protein
VTRGAAALAGVRREERREDRLHLLGDDLRHHLLAAAGEVDGVEEERGVVRHAPRQVDERHLAATCHAAQRLVVELHALPLEGAVTDAAQVLAGGRIDRRAEDDRLGDEDGNDPRLAGGGDERLEA